MPLLLLAPLLGSPGGALGSGHNVALEPEHDVALEPEHNVVLEPGHEVALGWAHGLTASDASDPAVADTTLPSNLLARGAHLREVARGLRIDGRPDEALGPATEAAKFLDQALAVAPSAADSLTVSWELAEALNQLGLNRWILSRFQDAVHSLEEARSLWRTLDHAEGLGRVHNNLGVVHYQWGNYDLALEAFLEALPYREAEADTAGMARVLSNVGIVHLDWGQYEAASQALERAVTLADASGNPSVRGYAWQTRASLHLALGDVNAAEEAYLLADSLSPGDRLNQASVGLALVRSARGDHHGAAVLLEAVVEQYRLTRQPRNEVRALRHLGTVHLEAGEVERARTVLEEALALAEAQEIRPLQAAVLEALALVQEAGGDALGALASLRRHHAVRDLLYSQGTGQRMATTEARLEADRRARENMQLRFVQQQQEERLARQEVVVFLGVALLLTLLALMFVLAHFNLRGRERQAALTEANAKLETANHELTLALSENRTLQGLIPICSSCRKVRDDKGYWEALETYVSQRSEANFSHSICADCGPRVYGEYWSDEEASAASTP